MKGIVDRIDNGILILEINKEYLELNVNLFPENIKEGDIVIKDGKRYEILEAETRKRKKEMDNLLESLFKESEDR